MVADAPRFADVAGEFEAFMDGAIFVAHNVNFDYGFVPREFARIGRGFRYPRLCTCSSMRKFFPGLPSYSLAELAGPFGIPAPGVITARCATPKPRRNYCSSSTKSAVRCWRNIALRSARRYGSIAA